MSKTTFFHYVCAVKLYSIKYLVSDVYSGRQVLTGWFTELIDNVWIQEQGLSSSAGHGQKKGNTDRIGTVLIRNHLKVLRRK